MSALLKSIKLKDYRSYQLCRVDFDRATVLVGPNGAGKSNLIDALHFLSDAVNLGLDAALTQRGGITAVRRRVPRGRPPDVEIEINVQLSKYEARYSVTIGSSRGGDWRLKSERFEALTSEALSPALIRYERVPGSVEMLGFGEQFPTDQRSSIVEAFSGSGALLLSVFSAQEPIGELYAFLQGMSFYSIFPDTLREPQRPLSSYPLDEYGGNLNSVIRTMSDRKRSELDRIRSALTDMVPGVKNFKIKQAGGYLTASVSSELSEGDAWFDASQCSDGTLRILGILVALHQHPTRSFVAIEEPELTVHPGVLPALADEIMEASQRSQVLVSTHSPDLVARLPIENLRVVEGSASGSRIGPVSDEQRQAVNDLLFSSGDLLRLGMRQEGSAPVGL
ncbi:MAG: AAA family ATPase [Chloroflexota bacterium]|nr:AAA family ATPase [Chloroflexota bacterium]